MHPVFVTRVVAVESIIGETRKKKKSSTPNNLWEMKSELYSKVGWAQLIVIPMHKSYYLEVLKKISTL